ncbi:hypothetical protein IFM89_021981 [Coptis chinensis]|uniref:Uncharacterized protein n=1 Tax=Coptis chinensis TaxID=261450 RepID=A0A835I478_9MAGN|nr:hypothetical protein IFM89_021981 [Coptis chinensis]
MPSANEIASEEQKCIDNLCTDFKTKMSDDLHTQDFLNGAFLEMLRLMNKLLDLLKKVLQQLKEKALKRAGLTEEDVACFIEERVRAERLC